MSAQDRPQPEEAEGGLSLRQELVELMKLAGPVVASRVGVMVMGLVNAVVVGRYSAEQLGFHAMAWAPVGVAVTMAIGLLSGIQVMTARAVGAGRPEETGAVLRRGIIYALWIGVAAGLVLGIGGPPLLGVLGLAPDLVQGATAPLEIFALCLPMTSLGVAASFWLEGHSRPGPAAWFMWAANLVNLVLVVLLAPGTFGLPAMGAVGAAWATAGARTVLAVALLVFIVMMPEARTFGVFRRAPRDRAAEAEQRRIGLGAGASNFFETAAFSSMNVIAGWVGALAVAAWAIVLNIVAIVFMAPLGMAAATAVRVGAAYGARDPKALSRRAVAAFAVTAAIGIVASLVVWPSAGALAGIYTKDVGTIALAAPALALAGLFLVADALQVVIAQALRAMGDVWVPTLTHLMSYVFFMTPLAWWLAIPLEMGLIGIVLAVTAASYLSAGLLGARFWAVRRARA